MNKQVIKNMDDLINKISFGDSFELIKSIDDKSIDLLITDPPYFFTGGYKENDWDNVKFILTDSDKKELGTMKTNKQKEFYLLNIIKKYFTNLIDNIIPKLKHDASLIIFNKLSNVEYMQHYLNDNYNNWESHIFEWTKTNPSPFVQELNKSEYALIATNITGTSDNRNFARLLEYQQSSEVFGSQITAKPPSKNELTSYMKLTEHDTPKPFHLWKELIKIYSDKGDLILDMFSGSGTTAFVSTELYRNFISFEFNENYYKSSTARLNDFKKFIPKSLFPE